MRILPLGLLMTLAASVSPGLAGITVTSYSTLAQTNGFAPSFQGPYYEQQTLTSITPALAQVSGDWTGPNADGTPNTWHWVGSSRSSSTTTFDANSYTVTAAGSFEYQLDTTAAFVDPRPSVLTPTGAANYEGFFTTDSMLAYSIIGELTQRARVQLNTSSGTIIFFQSNQTSVPVSVNFTGIIPAGQYRVLITTGLSAPALPNGVNHYEASGRYTDLIFNVQIPEPSTFAILMVFIGCTIYRRK